LIRFFVRIALLAKVRLAKTRRYKFVELAKGFEPPTG
jgi:hypothetical protein